MMPNGDRKSVPSLRERAEELLREGSAHRSRSDTEDAKVLLHELSVYQMELEIQNEELVQTRDRYAELYEFAPVGYVTIDEQSQIVEANLTAATMLGIERRKLLETSLVKFLAAESQEGYYSHWQDVFSNEEKQTCEITFQTGSGGSLIAQLESVAFGPETDRRCRTAIIDITERKRAEAAQRHEQALNESLINTAQSVIVILDSRGRMVRINPYFEELTGWRSDEVQGRDWFETFLPEHDREPIWQLFQRALAGERTRGHVNPILTREGEQRFIEWHDAMLTTTEGEFLRLICIGQDVTERLEAEQVLRESERRFRLLFEKSLDGILIADDQGRFSMANDAVCRLLGYSREELLKMTVGELQTMEQRSASEQFQDYLAKGKETGEFAFVRPDGQQRIVEYAAVEFAPGAHLSILRDVTERKRSEIELREAYRRLEAVVETAPSLIVVTDRAGCIVHFNRACQELTGYTRGEMVGERIADRLVPTNWRSVVEERFHEPKADGVIPPHENPWITKSGEERLIEWRCITLPQSSQHSDWFLLGIGIDITERKQSEREIARLAAIVEASDDAILRKSLDGTIETWNPGAERLYGYSAQEAVGQSVFMFVPPDRVNELWEVHGRFYRGERIDPFETVRVRKDGRRIDVSLTISPIRDPDGKLIGASSIARDISVQKQSERTLRQQTELLATINRISRTLASELELDRALQNVTDAATEVTGAEFGAFFYNAMDEKGESYLLHAVCGVPRDLFDGFPMPRNTELFAPTLRGDAVVRLDDVTTDPRYGKNPPYHGPPEGHLPVRSYLAVPVVSRTGEVHGGLFLGHRQVGVFMQQHEELATGIAAEAAIAIDNARLYEAVRHQRDRIQQYLDVSGSLMVALDCDGRVSLANRKACEVLGYRQEEVVGRDWFEHFLPPRLRNEPRKVFGQIIAGQVDAVEFYENPVLTADGQERIIQWHNAEVRDPDGQIVGVLGAGMDITERRQAEASLYEHVERLRAIHNTAADAIVTIDNTGIIKSVNPATERMFGYAQDELISQNVKILMPPPFSDDHDEYIRHYLETGEARIIGIGREVLGRRKDGSLFPLDLAVSEVDHLGLFVGILRDISDRRELEKHVLEIAAEEDRRIGHELHDNTQQQLTGLGLFATTLAEGLAGKSAPEAPMAKRLAEGIQQTTEQVHLLSRGLVPVEVEAEGLRLALTELANRVSQQYGIPCEFRCEDPIKVNDNFLATHLYRITQEAITNAVKHGRAKQIEISLSALKDSLTLQIVDNGIGIGDKRKSGSGMGLRIMNYRASLIGATINIVPREQGGTLVNCAVLQSRIEND